jgi:hypothetical protein
MIVPALLGKRHGGADALGIGETPEPEPRAWHVGFEAKALGDELAFSTFTHATTMVTCEDNLHGGP